MDIFEAIDTRHTTRVYTNKKPTIDEVKRIINSARLAPSACNTQNWKFIAVLNDGVKKELANAILNKYDEFEEKMPESLYSKIKGFKNHSIFFTRAPLLIVCVKTYAPKFLEGVLEEYGLSNEEILDIRPDSELLSMGGAVENMSLACHALGYSSCWMVAPLIAQEEMRHILNLKKPDQIVSLLSVGEEEIEVNRAPKKDLDEIIEIIK